MDGDFFFVDEHGKKSHLTAGTHEWAGFLERRELGFGERPEIVQEMLRRVDNIGWILFRQRGYIREDGAKPPLFLTGWQLVGRLHPLEAVGWLGASGLRIPF